MYEYADKIIKLLDRYFIQAFPRLKSLTAIDELNVLNAVNSLYAELDQVIRKYFLALARQAYKDASEEENLFLLDAEFLQKVFSDYNPVSKYVYINEFDRKRSRLAEALIATGIYSNEVDTALRQLSLMTHCYAITIVDEATLEAYRQEGVKSVRWISETDSKVCSTCLSRNNKIYLINELPPKPHYNCRCYFQRVV